MIPLLLILLGLVLGSFVNALVWRLREGRDWVNDRSECTHCHHKLAPLDLIPVFSWLYLRGKCRYCHKKIDDTPLTELVLPALFIVSYAYWPFALQGIRTFEFALWLVFLVGFLALAVYDLRWFLLPDKLIFPLAGLAGAQVIILLWRCAAGIFGDIRSLDSRYGDCFAKNNYRQSHTQDGTSFRPVADYRLDCGKTVRSGNHCVVHRAFLCVKSGLSLKMLMVYWRL